MVVELWGESRVEGGRGKSKDEPQCEVPLGHTTPSMLITGIVELHRSYWDLSSSWVVLAI